MVKAKVDIPVKYLSLLSHALKDLAVVTDEIIEQCKKANHTVRSDGWPTAGKGIQHIIDQIEKFAGPESKIHKMWGGDILLPGQELPRTKSTRQPKKNNKAETKAARLAKTKPKGDDNSK